MDLGTSPSVVLRIVTSCGLLLWSLSAVKRVIDEKWELHLPVGLRMNIYDAVRDSTGLGKWKD